MKKWFIAAAIALSVFNFAETEAASVSVDNAEIVEMGPWTKFRDHITGKRAREKEREREREYWERERHHHDSYHRGPHGGGGPHNPPPPPPPPPRRGR